MHQSDISIFQGIQLIKSLRHCLLLSDLFFGKENTVLYLPQKKITRSSKQDLEGFIGQNSQLTLCKIFNWQIRKFSAAQVQKCVGAGCEDANSNITYKKPTLIAFLYQLLSSTGSKRSRKEGLSEPTINNIRIILSQAQSKYLTQQNVVTQYKHVSNYAHYKYSQ